jgi:hypothetical protein
MDVGSVINAIPELRYRYCFAFFGFL